MNTYIQIQSTESASWWQNRLKTEKGEQILLILSLWVISPGGLPRERPKWPGCTFVFYVKPLLAWSWYTSIVRKGYMCWNHRFQNGSGRVHTQSGVYWIWPLSATVICTLSRLTLCNPMEGSPLGFSVHGVFQARILEWVAMPSSRGSSWPRDWTQVFGTAGRFFTFWAAREALY